MQLTLNSAAGDLVAAHLDFLVDLAVVLVGCPEVHLLLDLVETLSWHPLG